MIDGGSVRATGCGFVGAGGAGNGAGVLTGAETVGPDAAGLDSVGLESAGIWADAFVATGVAEVMGAVVLSGATCAGATGAATGVVAAVAAGGVAWAGGGARGMDVFAGCVGVAKGVAAGAGGISAGAAGVATGRLPGAAALHCQPPCASCRHCQGDSTASCASTVGGRIRPAISAASRERSVKVIFLARRRDGLPGGRPVKSHSTAYPSMTFWQCFLAAKGSVGGASGTASAIMPRRYSMESARA